MVHSSRNRFATRAADSRAFPRVAKAHATSSTSRRAQMTRKLCLDPGLPSNGAGAGRPAAIAAMVCLTVGSIDPAKCWADDDTGGLGGHPSRERRPLVVGNGGTGLLLAGWKARPDTVVPPTARFVFARPGSRDVVDIRPGTASDALNIRRRS